MDQEAIRKFYKVVTPYALGVISILVLMLILLQFKYWRDSGRDYPFLVQRAFLGLEVIQEYFKKSIKAITDKLLALVPPAIKKTLAPENKKLRNFILNNQKIISQTYIFIMLLTAFWVSRHILHSRFMFIPLLILLVATHIQLDNLLAYFVGNAIFQVCPYCGYANKKLVERCSNCNHTGTSGLTLTRLNNVPEIYKEEITEYKKAKAYDEVPTPILKGMNTATDEVVLLFKWVLGIKKNRTRLISDVEGAPCMLNSICLTNKKIYVIARGFGGWRTIESYPYQRISKYFTDCRFMPDIVFELLGDVDKLTIVTDNGNEYFFKGFNPQKLFLAIVSCIRKRQAGLTINGSHKLKERDN